MRLILALFILATLLIYILASYSLWKKHHQLYFDNILAIQKHYLMPISIFVIFATFIGGTLGVNSFMVIFGEAIAIYLLIYLTTLFYHKYLNPYYTNFKVFLYYCSLILGAALIMPIAQEMVYGYVPLAIMILSMTSAGFSVALIPFVFMWVVEKLSRKSESGYQVVQSSIKKTSKNMMKHYKEHGLTPNEIESFRQQMELAKNQIQSLKGSIQHTAKLRAIETRNNTIKVCQSFFKDIVDEPQRIGEADQFLYRFLPSLEDLVQKYNEINNHVAKNKQTYQILEKSAQTIDLVCQQITDEYIVFHQDDYDELSDEVQLAHLNIKRRNREVDSTSIDDIIKKDLGGTTHDHE